MNDKPLTPHDAAPALRISVVIPARNEASSIGRVVADVLGIHPEAEVIVVNDGSDDDTSRVASDAGARLIDHPYNKGNGASIKAGARAATGDVLVLMDGDGQHRAEDISRLLNSYLGGYDMVVGARRPSGQSGSWRRMANAFYSWFASWIVGQRILDLTSGFRVVDARKFREYLYLLPNGFSYPTTVTMAFFRSGYSVKYEYVDVEKCSGGSHIRLMRDGIKFLLIIFRVGTLYSPLKIFFPLAAIQFGIGIAYYLFTYFTSDRFTNMSALLLTSSLTVFLVGLMSEQITALIFKHDEYDK